MKLLIDANILLDVLENHQPHVEASSLIWKLCEVGRAEGYISALTFANLVYVMRKELSTAQIEEVWNKLRLIFYVADLTEKDMDYATTAKWEDFEDAIQSATASRVGADYIITRNEKAFARSKVPAISPADLLQHLT